MNNVEKFSFHDAYINGINIITIKDHFEKVNIFLESNEFMNCFGTSKVSLVFEDCYKADLQLQMWISGKDTIRELRLVDDSSSQEIKKIIELKEKGFIKKDDIFIHCEIILNTSGSKIVILAKGIKVKTY